jgi:hypothetical protein
VNYEIISIITNICVTGVSEGDGEKKEYWQNITLYIALGRMDIVTILILLMGYLSILHHCWLHWTLQAMGQAGSH